MSVARPWFVTAVLLLWSLVGSSAQAFPSWGQPPAAAGKMRVAFINALAPNNPLSRSVTDIMDAAARDLGIDLVQYTAAYWPEEKLELVRQVLDGPVKPDYLIISLHHRFDIRVLELAEQAHVPVFAILSSLTPEDKARLGGPRQRFKSWLGEMVTDDETAGAWLALLLRNAAHTVLPAPPVSGRGLVALEGRGSVNPVMRSKGLRQALGEMGDVDFLQGVRIILWDPESAQRKMALLLRRYPDLQMVWAANDALALEALRALEAAGRHPGRDVMVGGMGWTPRALQAIRDGKLVTSLGGYLLEGAWALVLLYDYHYGKDFASEQLSWRAELLPITRDNVDEYFDLFGEPAWEEIDFRAFSKVAYPALKRYDFSVQALLEQRRGRSTDGPPDTHGPARPTAPEPSP
jgi:ABC-type sugar transport system substrate-binding protein